ncbi:MAG: selenium metabolism-associated LysR family transcriptional regulator [Planctomycetota bacterium]|nr:selenium metabolism-associated LysR family transcriptional regulator [Planctomycetota bacterium]
METRHLRTFVAAAEASGFTEAAKQLGVTQAAVSQQMAALEKQLGVRLFERAHRAVQLTDDGRRLLEHARRILELIEAAVRELSGSGDTQQATRLHIASSTIPAEYFLPSLLHELRIRVPNIQTRVSISDSCEATSAVESGDADAALVGELPLDDRLTSQCIGHDELLLVVAPSHRWAGRSSVALKQLRGESFIVRESGSGTRRCLERSLADVGISLDELTVELEVNSNEAIRAAVQQGNGVAFLSERAVSVDCSEKRLATVQVRGLKTSRSFYVVTRKQAVTAPALREFLDLASRIFKNA